MLLGQVIDYYHKALLQSPEALDYLKRRGIGHEEAIRTSKLGFANSGDPELNEQLLMDRLTRGSMLVGHTKA